jgi:hypothetical protein
MAHAHATQRIRAANADGVLTYLIDLPPEAMPAVRPRDLAAAWDAARAAALAERWGPPRLFRFRRDDGGHTDLALADVDATAWAAAVDATADMHSSNGLSLCLRLLALVDLLANAPWAAALFTLRRDGAQLSPALLQAASTAPLTREARFDQASFRATLPAALPSPNTGRLSRGAAP